MKATVIIYAKPVNLAVEYPNTAAARKSMALLAKSGIKSELKKGDSK